MLSCFNCPLPLTSSRETPVPEHFPLLSIPRIPTPLCRVIQQTATMSLFTELSTPITGPYKQPIGL